MGNLIKKELRAQVLDYRRLVAASVFKNRNQVINEKIIHLLAKQRTRELHVFLPMTKNQEPDCLSAIRWAWKNGVATLTTKTDFANRSLQHFFFEENTMIKTSSKGIPEPLNGIETNLTKTEVILVPLLVFDRNGHRIGYGGGYYDKILSEINPDTLKIGLCLSGGTDAFNFVEAHDQPLDMIITPFETLEINEQH